MMGADNDPNHYLSQNKAQFGAKGEGALRVKPNKPGSSLDLGKGPGEYLTQYQDVHKDKFGQRENVRLTP